MSNRAKGLFAIISSALGFALMALFVRLCDDYGNPISSFQKSFFRNFIAFLIALIAFVRVIRPAEGPPRRTRLLERIRMSRSSLALLTLRAALGTVGIFANFYALSHIAIAEGQTLNKTAPFFTVVFAWIFLKERISRRQLVSLVLALSGVILIARPGFAGAAAFPLAMGLLGGACAGGAYACVRALRCRAVDSTLIVLFFSVFSCLASLPFMAAGFVPMTGRQVMILAGAGAGAALGQFGITLAYGYAAPREIAVYDYSNILFTGLFGFLFFGQIPNGWFLLGLFAILVAVFRLSRSPRKSCTDKLSGPTPE